MAPEIARSWQFMAPEIAIVWRFMAPETANYKRFMASCLFFISPKKLKHKKFPPQMLSHPINFQFYPFSAHVILECSLTIYATSGIPSEAKFPGWLLVGGVKLKLKLNSVQKLEFGLSLAIYSL